MARIEDSLRDIAAEHGGMVTAQQAVADGISPMQLVLLARRGRLERAARGLYRFPTWPLDELRQYHFATLWPQSHRALRYAVVSHESAIELYNLTQLNPGVVHVTVPRKTRISRDTPTWLRLHFEDIDDRDRTFERGVPVVSIPRAIEDLAPYGTDLVHRAVSEARERRLLREDELERLVGRFGSVILEPYRAE
jgi:predicted transcriptional regulator of viral defense system